MIIFFCVNFIFFIGFVYLFELNFCEIFIWVKVWFVVVGMVLVDFFWCEVFYIDVVGECFFFVIFFVRGVLVDSVVLEFCVGVVIEDGWDVEVGFCVGDVRKGEDEGGVKVVIFVGFFGCVVGEDGNCEVVVIVVV